MPTLDEILKTTLFTELFTEGSKKEFRRLLKQTHPDLHPNDKEKAEKAFVHVNFIWGKKNSTEPVKAGDYSTPKPETDENTIITKKGTYSLKLIRRTNNGVNTYDAVNESGKINILIATHPKISTFLVEGTKNLKTIRAAIPDQYTEFFPETSDAFQMLQNKTKLFGIAQPSTRTSYTLKEVLEDYPKGISGKDIAWIYRRMLVALGNTHDAGYAHGAPTMEAFLIEPETHALKLTAWQYSQELGKDINMVLPETKKFYETTKTVTIKKDLQIATEAIFTLAHETTHKRMRSFLHGMKKFPTASAQEGLYEFDQLLKELYGVRTFHQFRMRRPQP